MCAPCSEAVMYCLWWLMGCATPATATIASDALASREACHAKGCVLAMHTRHNNSVEKAHRGDDTPVSSPPVVPGGSQSKRRCCQTGKRRRSKYGAVLHTYTPRTLPAPIRSRSRSTIKASPLMFLPTPDAPAPSVKPKARGQASSSRG